MTCAAEELIDRYQNINLSILSILKSSESRWLIADDISYMNREIPAWARQPPGADSAGAPGLTQEAQKWAGPRTERPKSSRTSPPVMLDQDRLNCLRLVYIQMFLLKISSINGAAFRKIMDARQWSGGRS
jgi:hypothetical protein